MITFARRLYEAYGRWQKDGGSLLAAGVAYYAAVAFFTLLLVLMSALGFFLNVTGLGDNAEQRVLEAIANYASPEVRQAVADMLVNQVQRKAAVGGPLGILALLLVAGALFAHFERAFDRIWNTPNRESDGLLGAIKNVAFVRLRAFVMLFGLGLLMVAIFAASMTLSAVKVRTEGLLPAAEWIWWVIEIGVSVALNTLVLTLLYTLLPKVPVRWSEGFAGGLLAAVAWEIGRLVLAAWIVGEKFSPYGIIGSFLAVMLWMYYAASVLFLGAEFVQVIFRECNPPLADAKLAEIAEKEAEAHAP